MSKLTRERAWSYALNLLGRRAYTESEMRERLAKRGAEQQVIDETIERLAHYRLIDDRAFSEAFIRSNRRRKGAVALRHQLRNKGVSEEVVDDSLNSLTESAQLVDAISLLQRNAWRFDGRDQRRNHSRAFAFLARRGFPAQVAALALEKFAIATAGHSPLEGGPGKLNG